RLAPAAWHRPNDLFARSQDVGFAPAIAGRASARKITDAIGVWRRSVGRADGDDSIGITGIGNRDVTKCLEHSAGSGPRLDAAVAGRRDNDNPTAGDPVALHTDGSLATGKAPNLMNQRKA